jgi:SAM-dependent methyltransferase
MSQSDSSSAAVPKEKTFSSYNQEQGKAYAQIRRDYAPNVYQTIIDHHRSTGGQLDTLLDVGCGPGTALGTLAPHFTHAVGLDPSEGMLATARSLGLVTSTGEPVRMGVSTAEALGANLEPPVADSSVDLITAANAAHWFDMSGFWPSAARVLKPGGSVALWTSGAGRVHPDTPNAAAIQVAMDEHEEQYLKPYFEPGNILVRNRYVDLPLPWTLAQPVPEFDETTFFRKDWQVGEKFFVGETEVDLDTFEKMMSTGSAVTRWRQAHPDDVGTERDVVRINRRAMEKLLHEAGVEKGKERLKGIVYGAVLMVKKKM